MFTIKQYPNNLKLLQKSWHKEANKKTVNFVLNITDLKKIKYEKITFLLCLIFGFVLIPTILKEFVLLILIWPKYCLFPEAFHR
jgi:uncharacterized membrane protein